MGPVAVRPKVSFMAQRWLRTVGHEQPLVRTLTHPTINGHTRLCQTAGY